MGIQNSKNRQKFSHLRLSLKILSDEASKLIEPSFSDKPVIKGSVYELKRKCGKPGCKCAQGELHSRMVLSASEKGKTRLRVIPHGFLVEVKIKVRRYQELRRARSRLVEVQRKMIRVMDEMEVVRREQIPASGKKKISR
jgi:hypothetical protein